MGTETTTEHVDPNARMYKQYMSEEGKFSPTAALPLLSATATAINNSGLDKIEFTELAVNFDRTTGYPLKGGKYVRIVPTSGDFDPFMKLFDYGQERRDELENKYPLFSPEEIDEILNADLLEEAKRRKAAQ